MLCGKPARGLCSIRSSTQELPHWFSHSLEAKETPCKRFRFLKAHSLTCSSCSARVESRFSDDARFPRVGHANQAHSTKEPLTAVGLTFSSGAGLNPKDEASSLWGLNEGPGEGQSVG